MVIGSALYFVSNGSDYSIKHPPEGKHHAIIQITIDREDDESSCTAFVVSDTQAITAGHCVDIDQIYMKTEHKDKLVEIEKNLQIMREGMKKLEGCMTYACSMKYREIEMTMDTFLPEIKEFKEIKPDIFTVLNTYGEDTGIKATAVYKNEEGRDYAFLKGDFKKFEKIPVRKDFYLKLGDLLRTCGYAGGYNPICTDFIAAGSFGFMYGGEGYFVKGMSGGPAIDKYGFAVGVISAMPPQFALIDTLVGVFNFESKKPIKKEIKPIKMRAKDR